MTYGNRKIRAIFLLTLIGAYYFFEYCNERVFPIEHSTVKCALVYGLFITGTVIIAASFVTLAEHLLLWLEERQRIYKKVQARKEEQRYVSNRHQIRCLITNPQGYQARLQEEIRKQEVRERTNIDMSI